MREEEIINMLQRYERGEGTADEVKLIESWYNKTAEENAGTPYRDSIFIENAAGLDLIYELSKAPDLNEAEDLSEEAPKSAPVDKPRKLIYWPLRITTIAASIIFLWGIWTLFFVPEPEAKERYKNDINPGSNKAILTLANGQQINLSDAKAGTLVAQAGLEILKDKDGQISYKVTGSGSSAELEYHTITTPNGGQYTVTLPDGSKIWLNAASTLKYPTTFAEDSRKVSLSGEAYFEIRKDKKRPFLVNSATQQVEVLGTHFNVSAYSDEAAVKTTLLEGSVKITPAPGADLQIGDESGAKILHPNEQSSLTKNNIQIERVDANDAIAWKSGEFLFRNEPLESIMRKIARWYDVKVVYEDPALGKQEFGGMISRSGKISEVLEVLEITKDVHFKVEGRTVIVKK